MLAQAAHASILMLYNATPQANLKSNLYCTTAIQLINHTYALSADLVISSSPCSQESTISLGVVLR